MTTQRAFKVVTRGPVDPEDWILICFLVVILALAVSGV